MDVRLSRAGIPERADPHDWNTWESYEFIHEKRLAEHQFIDSHTVEYEQDDISIYVSGLIFCKGGVVLEVDKALEIGERGGRKAVRGLRYRYVAWIPRSEGRHESPVLRYHNVHHRDDDYHHRVFDPNTGIEVGYEKLKRFQFPVLSEVIDEIALILEIYGARSRIPYE